MLLAEGPDLFPIEIKAGMTVTRDYFKGLAYLARVFPANLPRGSGLVHGGEDAQKRSDVTVVPFYRLTSFERQPIETFAKRPFLTNFDVRLKFQSSKNPMYSSILLE